MSILRLTPAAKRDFSSIWDYTQERWGVDQAETYADELHHAMERIAARPERGRRRDEVGEGYRCFSTGSHLIFYRESAIGIDVVRILHRRMDPERHL